MEVQGESAQSCEGLKKPSHGGSQLVTIPGSSSVALVLSLDRGQQNETL